MKHPFKEAFNELKAIGAPVFERSDHPGRFLLSAEDDDDDTTWADYWARGSVLDSQGLDGFGVNRKVTAITEKHGIFLEWETPGCLIAYT